MVELDEPIYLSAYDGQWPTLFLSETRRLASELPADIAFEHIGSTSVPGMLSKPIIDIMLGVEPRHSLTQIRAALVALGYEDMGEAGVPGRLYLRRRSKTAFNIAIVEHGGPIWIANLALRDYLRTNSDAAREYTEIKRSAFASGARSFLAYSDYKGAVVARLIDRALEPA